MESLPDQSLPSSVSAGISAVANQRSRFLTALGFGRGDGGMEESNGGAEMETEEEAMSESDTPDRATFPPADQGNEAETPDFRPLDESDDESPAGFAGGEPDLTAALADKEEELDDEPVADADGMVLRADEGGPDFIASGVFDESDAWEKDLMVSDDFGPIGEAPSDLDEIAGEPEVISPEEAPSRPAPAFPWLATPAEDGKPEASPEVTSPDPVSDEPLRFGTKLPGGAGQPKLPWASSSDDVGLSIKSRDFSAPIPESKATAGVEPLIPKGSAADPADEIDLMDGLLLDVDGPSMDPTDWSAPFLKGKTIPLDELPGEGEPEGSEPPQPPVNLKRDPDMSNLTPSSDSPSGDPGEENAELSDELLGGTPDEDAKADPNPGKPASQSPGGSFPWESASDIADDSSPSVEAETSPAPAPEPVKVTGTPGEVAAAASATPATSEIVDVACPECGNGLSLRREHLGIAGHCVWCQVPLVAATSGLDGVVRVFLIQPDAGIATATPPETGVATTETHLETTPEPCSLPESEPKAEPVAEGPDTGAVSPVEGEMVEPEVLDKVQAEPSSDPFASALPAETSKPVETPSPAGKTPPDSAAALWAERAAAVQQSLTGAVRPKPEDTAEGDAAGKTGSTTPVSKGDTPAFAWAKPEAEASDPFGSDSVADAAEPDPLAPAPAEGKAAVESTSPFDWKPPRAFSASGDAPATSGPVSPVDAASEEDKPMESPFSGPDWTGKPTDSNAAESPKDGLAGLSASLEKMSNPGSPPAKSAFGSSSTPSSLFSDSRTGDEPRAKTGEPSTAPVSDGDAEKPKDDPFGGGFGQVDDHGATGSKSGGEIALGTRAFGSKSEPGNEAPASATSSLFATAMGAGAEEPGKPKFTFAAGDKPEAKGEAATPAVTEEAAPSKKAEGEAPVPPEAAKAAPDKKKAREKSARKKQASPVSSPGKTSRLTRVLGWVLVIGGLLAGMGAAALFRDQIKAAVMPRLSPILQKVMPSEPDAPAPDSNAADPSGSVDVPGAPAAAAAPASTENPSADAVSGAVGDESSSSSDSSDQVQSSATASITTSELPPTELVPVKRNLFEGGSLLINDRAGETSSSE